MPTYDVLCRKCGRTHEVECRIGERNEQTCDDCGGKCDALISGGAFAFVKGGTPKFGPEQRDWSGTAEQRRELNSQQATEKRDKAAVCTKRDGSFKPFWHTNLGNEPVWIKSKRHLKDEVKRRNLKNSALGV